MANNSAVTDIGLVSPEWLQNSFDSLEVDALLSYLGRTLRTSTYDSTHIL